jgi:hypothetical protein
MSTHVNLSIAHDPRYFTQNQFSSIFNSSFSVFTPVQTDYTYKNFRFAPDFTLDTVRDRMYWFQQ